jgi:pilus assembly protein CpaB
LLLAVGAGALVFTVLQQQTTAAEQSRRLAIEQITPTPTLKLPVAAHPLAPGALLDSTGYVLKDFPLDLVPATAITDTASLADKVVVRTIDQGETFHASQFLGGSGAAISQQITPGHVLFAFPIVDLMSQSSLIQDGDHIDLLLTIQLKGPNGEDQGKSTAITLQNIEVFKVLRPQSGDSDKQPKPTALLFSMTPEDSVMVKFVKDSGGVIDFTLRAPTDKELLKVPAVDDGQLITRYGFR